MKNNNTTSAFERLKAKVKPEDREFAALTLDIVDQIHEILEIKKWSQKTLAFQMGKRESEISRLLSGTHNFSILTLAKLQVALDKTIICTPKRYKTLSNDQVSINQETFSSSYSRLVKNPGESKYPMAA